MRARAVRVIREAGATTLLLARALGRRGPPGSLARELNESLLRSTPLIVVSMAFVGAVVIVDGGRQVQDLFGDPSGMGPTILELVVREFGPVLGGIIAATRIGAGISAELAAMKVSEQIDALEMSSADPIAELVAPRTQAAFVALLVLGALATLTSALAGAWAAAYTFGTRPGAFLDPLHLDVGDFGVAFVKCALFGLAIPALSARAGLQATGGAQAVGRATTQGVVASIVSVVFLDFVVGGAALALGV